LNIKQLEYFVQVVESGSFTRAAGILGIAQPSLSRQVRLLETELQEHLLYRTGRGIEPTDAGNCLLEHGRAILARTAQARQDIHDLKKTPRGKVVVGLPPRLAHKLTPDLVHRFREHLPESALTVTEGLSVSLREWLREGRVDIGLLYDAMPPPTLDYETIFQEELMLVGSLPGLGEALPSEVRFDELAAYPLVLPCMPNATRAIVNATCRRYDVKLNVVAEVNAVQTLVALAESGEGYAVLSYSAVSEQVRAGKLAIARIGSPIMYTNLILCTARLRPVTRLVRETLYLLRTLDIPRLLRGDRFTDDSATRPTKIDV
jgi:LysR family transcriptional regulator, nitrogen assimilation regulatory protein